jgi:hypothetical protein
MKISGRGKLKRRTSHPPKLPELAVCFSDSRAPTNVATYAAVQRRDEGKPVGMMYRVPQFSVRVTKPSITQPSARATR